MLSRKRRLNKSKNNKQKFNPIKLQNTKQNTAGDAYSRLWSQCQKCCSSKQESWTQRLNEVKTSKAEQCDWLVYDCRTWLLMLLPGKTDKSTLSVQKMDLKKVDKKTLWTSRDTETSLLSLCVLCLLFSFDSYFLKIKKLYFHNNKYLLFLYFLYFAFLLIFVHFCDISSFPGTFPFILVSLV